MDVRITASDLREAARKSAAIRSEALARGERQPQVFLDVEVVVEHEVATAFAAFANPTAAPRSVRYVGTPRGLAGLIADVQRLGIADGVVLLTPSQDHVVALMLDELGAGLRPTG